MTTASDIAGYIVRSFQASGDPVSNLKLQKLLYYVQGWHLAATGTPLFPERIEAWQHGPVVRDIYQIFRECSLAIPPSEGRDSESMSEKEKEFVRSVWDRYKNYSATALRNMTHEQSPWAAARGNLPANDRSDAEITPDSMRKYFFPRFIKLLKRTDSRIDPVKWQASADAITAGRMRTTKEILCDLRHRRTGTDSK